MNKKDRAGKMAVLISFLFFAITVRSQRNLPHPVKWQYSAQKIGDRTYEVHITGVLDAGWHAYSQIQPSEAVAQPTVIKFASNPLLSMQGKTKEMGKMEKWEDKVTGLKANQYKDRIDFVQVVKVKADVRIAITGLLTYQVCTDEMCLPPQTDEFSIPLASY